MNIGVLLNRRRLLVSSSQKLNTLIRTSNRAQIISKSFLLNKKKELSDTRAKAFSSLSRQRQDDNANLLGIGAGIGGGASLLRKGKPKVSKGIGKVKGLGRLSKTNVLLNTAFTAADFMGRKSSGQTNLQAGVGSGAGLLGGLGGFTAGAKIGASIGALGGPVGIAIGGLLGGAVGSFAGSSLASGAADRATGVTGSNFRRKELEKQEVRINKRTEFTAGLDSFDKALDKFGKYDEDLKTFILRATGRDKDNQALKPVILGPFGRGNANQSDVDKAYRRGISTGVYRTVGVVVLGALAIKGGALLLKKKLLLSLLNGSLAKKILGKKFQFGLMKGKIFPKKPIQFGKGGRIIKKKFPVKVKPKVTKSKTKPFPQRKILKGQDKVTSSDKKQIFQKYELNKRKKFQRIKFDTTKKEVRKKKFKSNSSDVKAEEKVLENFLKENNVQKIESNVTQKNVQDVINKGKELDLLKKTKKYDKNRVIQKNNVQKIESNVTQQQIQDAIKSGKNYNKNRVIQKNLFNIKKFNTTTNKDISDVRIINDGNNIAYNPNIENPYLGTINTIKAYSELTA